jgi:hypothetical protein
MNLALKKLRPRITNLLPKLREAIFLWSKIRE